jgi:hypothetical protein
LRECECVTEIERAGLRESKQEHLFLVDDPSEANFLTTSFMNF